MKTKCLAFLLALALSSFKSDSPNEIIELPLKLVDGYGNFFASFALLEKDSLSDNNQLKGSGYTATGIPKEWNNVSKRLIFLDAKQLAYQNYKQGYLSANRFEKLKDGWNINLSKRPFSEKPIKCFVSVIYYKDNNGTIKYKIDSNNNRDFKDDMEFSAAKYDFFKIDSLIKHCSHTVAYESYRHGKVVPLSIPVLVVDMDGKLFNSLPQHAEAELNGRKFIVSPTTFTSVHYEETKMRESSEAQSADGVKENEFIVINGDVYKHLGVNMNRQVLMLKKLPKDTVVYSSQVGFHAKAFNEKEFTTHETLTLDTYKGKFIYLDFWGSWCKPCVKEIPEMKSTYSALDKSKIEFLGVALDETDRLRKLLDKEKLEWKQVMREQEDGIIGDYNVSSYPSSFLIDPNGKIIARNLRGENLLDTLNYFINKK